MPGKKSALGHKHPLNIVLDDIPKAQRTLQEIKNKIRALGSVNVGAVEEYKEVSERYEYMSGQLADIEKSREEKKQAKKWRVLSFSWNLFFYIASE